MDILAEINEIANEYVGDVNLKLDDTFDSLDFDSLDVVQIAMAVEKKYTPSLTPYFSASWRLYRALESGEISPSAIPRIPTRTMAKSTPDAAASAQRMVP